MSAVLAEDREKRADVDRGVHCRERRAGWEECGRPGWAGGERAAHVPREGTAHVPRPLAQERAASWRPRGFRRSCRTSARTLPLRAVQAPWARTCSTGRSDKPPPSDRSPAVTAPLFFTHPGSLHSRHVPCRILAGDDHGPERLALPGRRVLPQHPLPLGLPVQAAEGLLHHPHIPSEREQQWIDLLGHPERSVVAGADHLERCVAARAQPRVLWPIPLCFHPCVARAPSPHRAPCTTLPQSCFRSARC